jgi:Na+/H+ antiporter NhaD/arsenite permease-like protein
MGCTAKLMVCGSGSYKFSDYTKVVIPVTIVVGIVIVILSPLVFKAKIFTDITTPVKQSYSPNTGKVSAFHLTAKRS